MSEEQNDGMPKTLEEAIAMLQSRGGTITAEIEVTRKDTGKIERYTVSTIQPPKDR